MKNHPVNNEYVQNLVEGLQFESRRGAPGSAKARIQDADSENRREETQDAINTQAAEDGGSGVASDIEHGRWEPDIKDEGGSRQRPKVRGAKKPRPFKNTAGRILKKKIRVDEAAVRLDKKVKGEKPFQSRNPDTNRLESEISNNDDYTVTSKRRPDGSVKKGSTEQNASQSNEDWLTDNDDPKVKAKHDKNRLERKLKRKK